MSDTSITLVIPENITEETANELKDIFNASISKLIKNEKVAIKKDRQIPGHFRPEDDEECWVVDTDGEIIDVHNFHSANEEDRQYVILGRYSRTKDGALLIKEVDGMHIRILQKIANLNDSEDWIDWSDKNQRKYYIFYDSIKKDFLIDYSYTYNFYKNKYYLKSYDLAEQLIKSFSTEELELGLLT